MDYRQYTQCVEASKHSKMNQYVRMFLIGGLVGVAMAAVAIAAGNPLCALFAIPVFAAATQLAYASWWLNDRLICLGGDKYAVGLLISVEPPEKKTGFDALDTDYSINLLPYPNAIADIKATYEESKPIVEKSTPYGYLIAEQDTTKNIGVPFTGEHAKDEPTQKDCPVLHAEFEGGGVRIAFDAAGAALIISLAALVACMALPPPWNYIVAGILALLALLAQLFGALFGRNDKGKVSDVNPSLGALHPREDNGTLFDILGVYGTWVYDAGHNNQDEGWNEIHPIKACNRITQWDGKGDWPRVADQYASTFESALVQANSPTTKTAQQRPENQWEVHPLIDGCQPRSEPPDDPVIR